MSDHVGQWCRRVEMGSSCQKAVGLSTVENVVFLQTSSMFSKIKI
jgi:hypothetical protein